MAAPNEQQTPPQAPPQAPPQQTHVGEQLVSSGEFDDGTRDDPRELMDIDFFVEPEPLAPDATPEEILRYDPVESSNQRYIEQMNAQSEQEQQREAERQRIQQEAEQQQQTQAPQEQLPSYADPNANPPDPAFAPPTQHRQEPISVPMQEPGQFQQPQAQPEAQPPQPQVPQAPSKEQLLEAQLQAANARMQAMEAQIAQMSAAPAQQQPQVPTPQSPYGAPTPGTAQQAQPQEPLPNYAYQPSAQLVDAIRSEDPNLTAAGLSAMVQQVASAVHQQVREEYRNWVPAQVRDIAQQTYQETSQTQARHNEIRDDFYGTYPNLKNPALAGMVASNLQAVMEETGLPYNQVVRDAAASRIYSALTAVQGAHVGGQVQPQVVHQQAPAPVQNPAQAAMQVPGTRAGGGPAGIPGLTSEQQDMYETIYGMNPAGHPTGSFS